MQKRSLVLIAILFMSLFLVMPLVSASIVTGKVTETISIRIELGNEKTVTVAGIDHRISLQKVSSATAATIIVDNIPSNVSEGIYNMGWDVSKGSTYNIGNLQVYVKTVFHALVAGDISWIELDLTPIEECPLVSGWRIENNKCVKDAGCDYNSSKYVYYDTLEECESQLWEASISLEEGYEKTLTLNGTDYIISLQEISSATKAKIMINNELGEVLVGSTKTFGNLNVYTKEIYFSTIAGELGSIKLGLTVIEKAGGGLAGETEVIKPNEETGPIEIPKNITVEEEKVAACGGCVLENNCYPFGHRKSGQYCSDNKEFVAQSVADSSCENNFECLSNECSDGKCISTYNLLQTILNFLKKLLGIQ